MFDTRQVADDGDVLKAHGDGASTTLWALVCLAVLLFGGSAALDGSWGTMAVMAVLAVPSAALGYREWRGLRIDRSGVLPPRHWRPIPWSRIRSVDAEESTGVAISTEPGELIETELPPLFVDRVRELETLYR